MKKALCLLLAWLALVGALTVHPAALAEGLDAQEDAEYSVPLDEMPEEIEVLLGEDASEDEVPVPEEETAVLPDEASTPEDAMILSEPLDAEPPAPEEAAVLSPSEDADPVVLSVSKKATKSVNLYTTYQIEVPGKTVQSYKSSSKKIATVSKTGLIKLKKAGKVRITIKLSKKKQFVLTLKVVDPTVPVSVAIDQGKADTICVDDTLALSATVSPATAKQNVTWKSADKKIATVDKNGNVVALKAGKVKITATTPNKKKATLTLTVERAPRPVEHPYMISHAMGGIGGLHYSNCLEAFEENYAEGHRVFEVDLELTSDNRLVLCHDWKRKLCAAHKPGYKPTYKEFMGYKIYDKYTSMSVEDLLRLMQKYPDIHVITDTKHAEIPIARTQINALVNAARRIGAEQMLDRLTIEFYNKKMLGTVKAIYPFKSYAFTLYRLFKKQPTNAQMKNIGAFCQKNGVKMIAMYTKWWKPDFAEVLDPYNVEIVLHTTDNAADALRYLNDGVTALCTDFLGPI